MSMYRKLAVNSRSLLSFPSNNQPVRNFRNYFQTEQNIENAGPSINEIMQNVCFCNAKPTSVYDCRKYSHALPVDNNDCYPFETLPCIPKGVFRCTCGEKLGPGADKCGCYKNTEYFSFHHSSFFDLHLCMRQYRLQSPNSYKKP